MCDKIVMIDGSYFIFYRFYALCNWVKMSKTECECKVSDEIFAAKFAKMCKDTISKLKKTHKIDSMNKIYFVMDCHRKNIWRNQIYDFYKANRVTKNSFDTDVFTYMYENILPDIGCNVLQCCEAEADDIIGILCKYIKNCEIVVITDDNDYLQLADDRIYLYNLKQKCINKRVMGDKMKDLFYKILVGDKSDNIPSICTDAKAKQLLNLCSNEDAIINEVAKLNKGDQYELNKTLIDMRMIPTHIVTKIIECYNTSSTFT